MSHLRWFFNVATVQARCSAATVLVVCVNSLVDAETNRRLFAVTSESICARCDSDTDVPAGGQPTIDYDENRSAAGVPESQAHEGRREAGGQTGIECLAFRPRELV